MLSEIIVARQKNKTRDSRPVILSGIVVLFCLFESVSGNEYLPFRMFFGDILSSFFGIPILRNPTHTELLNDDILLIMASLESAFTYRNIALHANVQQALPIDLKHRANGGGNSQSNAAAPARSVRGGTRYQVSMDFVPQ